MKTPALLLALFSATLLSSFVKPTEKTYKLLFYSKERNLKLFVDGEWVEKFPFLYTEPDCDEQKGQQVLVSGTHHRVEVRDSKGFIKVKGTIELSGKNTMYLSSRGDIQCNYQLACDRYEVVVKQ
jgi:hypothetical protein